MWGCSLINPKSQTLKSNGSKIEYNNFQSSQNIILLNSKAEIPKCPKHNQDMIFKILQKLPKVPKPTKEECSQPYIIFQTSQKNNNQEVIVHLIDYQNLNTSCTSTTAVPVYVYTRTSTRAVRTFTSPVDVRSFCM